MGFKLSSLQQRDCAGLSPASLFTPLGVTKTAAKIQNKNYMAKYFSTPFVIINMNILLQNWEYPPFDKIKTDDYEPAVREAIAEAERNIEVIATNMDDPTFENTVEALETASQRLDRVSAIMMNLNECCTNEELQEVVMRMEPLMTRFSMKVMTDERLYRRALNSERKTLSTEQQTLL